MDYIFFKKIVIYFKIKCKLDLLVILLKSLFEYGSKICTYRPSLSLSKRDKS